jgi:hypothetical protein
MLSQVLLVFLPEHWVILKGERLLNKAVGKRHEVQMRPIGSGCKVAAEKVWQDVMRQKRITDPCAER